MSTDPHFVCPLDVLHDLWSMQVKRMFQEDDLVMKYDGSTCLYGTPDKLFTPPIPGCNLGTRCWFISSERVVTIRKKLAAAVALEVMARVNAVPCHDEKCPHNTPTCTQPNFMQRAFLLTYDDSDEAKAIEKDRQHALHKSGYSVHIHYDNPSKKKRKSKE